MTNSVIESFKAECQQTFDELLPQAIELIEEHTGEKCDRTCELKFKDTGKAAGKFSPVHKEPDRIYYRPNVIINSQLMRHRDAIRPTIQHELAHFVIEIAKRELKVADTGRKWSNHGSEWKKAAKRLGDSGNRCHSLRLDPAMFKVRLTVEHKNNVRHEYLTNKKDAGKFIGKPGILDVEIKNSEGFWVRECAA